MKILDQLLIKEKKNELEVEDILDLVKTGDPTLIPGLQELKLRIAKTDTFSVLSIPFDRWIDVVCEFLEHGYAGPVEIAKKDKYLATFAISALEASKTREGFVSILNILNSCNLEDSVGYKNAGKCISGINLMISFDDDVKFSKEEADLARLLVHNYLNFIMGKSFSEGELVVAYCALRKLGNHESIQIIKKMPPLQKSHNSGIDKMVLTAIRKRIKKR